jgi:hypothetical protein
MEGFPDDHEGRSAVGPGHRQPAKPNLWILVGMTLLALAISVAVLVLTAL